ncbi:prohibitin [Scenedesmus sp. NREL 46B-D3]|nr:prohibitin [Scenedesmus sp. NREL 46B-D3]
MAESAWAAAVIGVLNKVIKYAIGLGAGASALQTSLYNVDGGERAVIFDRFRGILPEVVGEGTHVRIPWIQTPHIMDIRTRPRSISSVTGTKGACVKCSTLRLPGLGMDWEERVLPSIGNEVVKAVVAQYNAEQLLTQREKVSHAIRDALMVRAADFGIVLEDIAITHLSFGTEFTKAVEMKQVAEQDAERARFVVLKAEQERNAAIIRAEGESEAAKLISDATKSAGAGLVELRRIEAAKDIAETMSKSQNVVYLPSGGNMLLGINPR